MNINKTVFDRIKDFFSSEYAIGIVITLAAVLGLICANSPLKDFYTGLLETELSVTIGSASISQNLHHWINDGLMTLFFFVAGLEIKRELIDGELNTLQKAALPFVAALGGMVVPALVYLAFSFGSDQIDGWGIPMATDIAFCLGLIALIGKHVSSEVKVFLLSLAIVDDIGAVLVIALFYSSSLDWLNISLAGGAFVALMLANFLGLRNKWLYFLGGLFGIWLAIFFSGLHPTIAGILLAFTIPADKAISDARSIKKLTALVKKMPNEDNKDNVMNSEKQLGIIEDIRVIAEQSGTPLQFSENLFHGFVYFLIVPIFAFANAGITINNEAISQLGSPVALGIIAGLMLGKPLGILLFTWLAVKVGLTSLPSAIGWNQVAGVGMMAGIGFTMSLFIADLAFSDNEIVTTAKLAVLIASLLMALVAMSYLRFAAKSDNE